MIFLIASKFLKDIFRDVQNLTLPYVNYKKRVLVCQD